MEGNKVKEKIIKKEGSSGKELVDGPVTDEATPDDDPFGRRGPRAGGYHQKMDLATRLQGPR